MEQLNDVQRETLADHAWKTQLVKTELASVLKKNEELEQELGEGSRRLFATKVRITKKISELDNALQNQRKVEEDVMDHMLQIAGDVEVERNKKAELEVSLKQNLQEMQAWKQLKEECENVGPILKYNELFVDVEIKLENLSKAIVAATVNRAKQFETWAVMTFAATQRQLQSYKARLDDRQIVFSMLAEAGWPLKAGTIEDNERRLMSARRYLREFEELKNQWIEDMTEWKVSPRMLVLPKLPRWPKFAPLEPMGAVLGREVASASSCDSFEEKSSLNNSSEDLPSGDVSLSTPVTPDLGQGGFFEKPTSTPPSDSDAASKPTAWGDVAPEAVERIPTPKETLKLTAEEAPSTPVATIARTADDGVGLGESSDGAISMRDWASLDNKTRVTLFFNVLQNEYGYKKEAVIPILLQLKEKRKNLEDIDHINLLRYVVDEAKKLKPVIQRGKKRMYNLNRPAPPPAPTTSAEDLKIVFRDVKKQWGQVSVTPAKSNFLGNKPVERECVICLCDLGTHDLTTTECGHWYHAECLREWTGKYNRSCPLCRYVVLSKQDFPTLDGLKLSG